MQMKPLGRTGLQVSELCLGSMTWGTQTGAAQGHAQIDAALDAGINIIDTAEVYPVNPMSREKAGRSEETLGTWNSANPGRRADYILATKVAGQGQKVVRDGGPITPQTIATGIEGSLRRLQTDYIDLYQLHWPNRGSYMFRQNWTYDPTGQDRAQVLDNMAACLDELQRQIDMGNIRFAGLSNESAWGTMQWLRLSEAGGGPRMQSVQNEYSLLCRLYDTDMAELTHHEEVGLLAFSPLAAGLLTGKYQHGHIPDGSRRSLVPELTGRYNPRALEAVDAYLAIAQRHGIDPVHMALAWCRTRPFMASAIFGATTFNQLTRALGAAEVVLSDEVLAEITAAHRAHPLPF